MKEYTIAVLPGDGIGPEVVGAALTVLRAAEAHLLEAGATLSIEELPVGLAAHAAHGTTLPVETLERARRSDGILLGPLTTHAYAIDDPRMINPSKVLRKELDLFANVRPVRSYPAVRGLHADVDLVVVRENTEGFYADRNVLDGNGELRPDADTVLSIRVVTRRASLRLARAAFELARRRPKRRVSVAHKANVLRHGCGLFLDACATVAKEYPEVTMDAHHVDALAMHLVMRPQAFDVLACTNLFGDVLSDLTAGLVGGLGLAPGLNAGSSLAMAQAVHGSAPDIAGRGTANPVAEILSTAMLLRWLGERHADAALCAAADRIETGVTEALERGNGLTPDLGGAGTTAGLAATIANAVAAAPSLEGA